MAGSPSIPVRVATVVVTYDLGDREEIHELAKFATVDEAIAAGRALVDNDLRKHYQVGFTGKELYRRYVQSSGDLSVDAALGLPVFYGWKYAKKRCLQICGIW